MLEDFRASVLNGLIVRTDNVRIITRILVTVSLLILCTQMETSILYLKVALFCICRFLTFFSYHKRSFIPFASFNVFIIQKLSINSSLIILKNRRKSESAVIKPVGEVLLPRRSGILRASLCKHQQICNCHICRPRIPHALCPCGFSHRHLLCDVRGANPLVCCHFHTSCRLHHQWLLGLNTLHH